MIYGIVLYANLLNEKGMTIQQAERCEKDREKWKGIWKMNVTHWRAVRGRPSGRSPCVCEERFVREPCCEAESHEESPTAKKKRAKKRALPQREVWER